MGIVVNHPAPLMMADVAKGHGFTMSPGVDRAPVFLGGPVEPERGFVLHKRDDLPEALPLFDGMYVSGSLDSLKALLLGSPDSFRLCLGYAGWGPGQLEKELREGSWITASPSARHVLETPAPQVWETVLKEMGIDPAMLVQSGGLQ